jgi:hypothetical protein
VELVIAARIARRSLMDRLLLDGMAWTNANPWFGFAGLAVTIVLAGMLEKVMP